MTLRRTVAAVLENMPGSCKSAAVIAGAVLLLLGIALVALLADRAVGSGDPVRALRAKTYSQTIAEGVKVNRHGLYGIDLVRCGACRLRKRKHGIFTIGAMNVLVIDDLAVVLPRDDGSAAGLPNDAEGSGAMSLARRMGVSDGFLAARGVVPKFSGLSINRLSVSRLSEDGIPAVAFTANSAEAVHGGLKLSGCVVQDGGDTPKPVSGAMLKRDGRKLSLVWRGGSLDLN